MAATNFRVLPTPYEQALRDKRRRKINKALLITLFLLPGMVIFTLFVLIPLPQSAYFSLYDWNGLGPLTDFKALGNYERLIGHSRFQQALVPSRGAMGK